MLQIAPNLLQIDTESIFAVMSRTAALEAKGKSVINLCVGQPDFKTAPHIVEAAVKALHDGHHGYTLTNGILPLREAVSADLHRRYRAAVDPRNVVIVPGGKLTLFFAILMFGQPGAEIIYPDPGFPTYKSLIDYCGATAVPIVLREENGFAFSAEEVLAKITPRTRLLIINSPANPTGGVVPRSEWDKLAAGIERHPHVAILSDEIYSQILYDGQEHVSLLHYEHLRDRSIILDGWSKTYAMTGWRLGFGVWPEKLVEYVIRLAVHCHSCVNASTQYAGIAALNGPQDMVKTMVEAFDARRRIIVAELNGVPGVSCIEPGGAFYAFPNIKATGRTAQDLQDWLLEEAGVATLAGTAFGDAGEGYLRFSYASSVENIREAVARIKRIL